MQGSMDWCAVASFVVVLGCSGSDDSGLFASPAAGGTPSITLEPPIAGAGGQAGEPQTGAPNPRTGTPPSTGGFGGSDAGAGGSNSGASGGSGAVPPASAHSCVGACGGAVPDTSCWCDVECTALQDCCPDYHDACASQLGTVGCTASHCGTDTPTTEGNGAPCYCDAACAEYEDCCSNKQQTCG